MTTSRLVRNAIRCKHCGDEIESKHQHDFRYCKCGKVAVDGGLSYARRLFPELPGIAHYEDLSVYEEDQNP